MYGYWWKKNIMLHSCQVQQLFQTICERFDNSKWICFILVKYNNSSKQFVKGSTTLNRNRINGTMFVFSLTKSYIRHSIQTFATRVHEAKSNGQWWNKVYINHRPYNFSSFIYSSKNVTFIRTVKQILNSKS